MGFKFTTIKECQDKIDQMNILIQEFKGLNNIQFPIADDENKQFQHYSLHHIREYLIYLEECVVDLQEELNRYKRCMCEEN